LKTVRGSSDPKHVRKVAFVDGGVGSLSGAYPPRAAAAVFRGLKDALRRSGAVSALEEAAAGPVAEDAWVDFEGEEENDFEATGSFWDDVKGGWLQPEGVQEARREEIEWMQHRKVFEVVKADLCWKDTGKAPMSLRWVDTNKGDSTRPRYRSRLVAREVRRGKTRVLPDAMLFSAMPPLEAMKGLASLLVTRKKSRRGKTLKIGLWDVSRAHLYGVTQRLVYTELPEELARPGYCARLLRSLYGTQDASNIWQADYTKLFMENGWEAGKSNPAVFACDADDGRALCHGDDLMVLGDQDCVNRMDDILRSRYDVKKLANLGLENGDDREVVMLNRVLRIVETDEGAAMEVEADSRHAELIVKKLGLSDASAAATPNIKRTEEVALKEAEEPALDAVRTKEYRSLTMRGAYLAQDRADIGETCKQLCRWMKAPTEAHWRHLKRFGRYLKGVPRVVTRYDPQPEQDTIGVDVDSDHAGCPTTRRSTTGHLVRYGTHTWAHGSHLQSTISLSSGESEFYALVKGAAKALMIKALMADWHIEVSALVRSDSSSARSFTSRRGLGRQRHVMTRFLWIQERVAAGHIRIARVGTDSNAADLLTKALPAKRMWDLMPLLGQMRVEGRSALQRSVD